MREKSIDICRRCCYNDSKTARGLERGQVFVDRKTLVLMGVAAFCVAVWVYTRIKEKKNIGLAQNGEDMSRLRDAVAAVLPGETGYQVVYAHWEKVEYYGRSRKTTYYCYALAFSGANRLWVIPLGFNDGEIRPGRPIAVTKEALGVTKIDTRTKNGMLSGLGIVLMDKDGGSPVNLDVDAMNTRSDRFHHLNIYQQLELEQFQQFMSGMADQVRQENVGLEDRLHDEMLANSAKGSRTLGILGIVFCWTGLVGLIFGGIGLVNAPKPSETGGVADAPFKLCLIATILSALMLVFGAVAIFVL